MTDPYNSTTLDEELRAAGLDIHGCSSKGRVDWKKPPTPAEEKKAKEILRSHDPRRLPRREARLEELKEKRRKGQALTPQEYQEVLDLLLKI